MDREDHHLKYIMLPATPKPTDPDATEPSFEIKRFNLNPNGDDHVSFSILYVRAPLSPIPSSSKGLTTHSHSCHVCSVLCVCVRALALHPGGKHIALLTGNHASGAGNLSRVFLYKFLDGERKATIWTGACTCP